MIVHFHFRALFVALLALAATFASAETRMQVSASTAPVYSRPSANAQRLGQVSSGEILFVTRVENDWAAISPPDRFGLWLNRDFIEGNRVLARTIQVRAGPGIQHDVVGTLQRGDAVMPRSEEGDWRQIAPPSSATLWVRQADLSEVLARTEPIREVATVPKPKPPPPPERPAPRPEPKPEPQPPPRPVAVAPAPAPAPAPEPVQVATALPERLPPEQSIPTPKIAPSSPQSPEPAFSKAPADKPKPAPRPAPATAKKPSAKPAATQKPAKPKPAAPAQKTPATAKTPPESQRKATASRPASKPEPVRRAPAKPSPRKAAPVPASAVTAQRSGDVAVEVDDALVEDLNIDYSIPKQGKAVQVEGELRSAPFLTASPSRYRLLAYDGRILEMVCHIHGDSAQLRQYIGKGVSIRGSQYWVEESDMPVVVVGQIVPLATVANEPVMF